MNNLHKILTLIICITTLAYLLPGCTKNEQYDSSYELMWKKGLSINDTVFSEFSSKRILGIGESTHGTKEFYDLRIAVINAFLKKKTPFNILCELTVADGEIIDNYINNPLEYEVLRMISYPLLRNTSFDSLLRICKKENTMRNQNDRIHLYGIDPSYDESLINHLNATLVGSGIDVSNDIRIYFKNLKFHNLIDLSHREKDNIKFKLLSLKKFALIDNNLKHLLAINQFLQALDRLEVPVNSLNSQNRRDSSMAKNVELIASRGTYCNILFAHNEHLRIGNSENKTMGTFLNSDFKNNYHPVGVDFIMGHFRVNENGRTKTYYSKNDDEFLNRIVRGEINNPIYVRTDNKKFDRIVTLHVVGGNYNHSVFKAQNLMDAYRGFIIFESTLPTQELSQQVPFHE